MEDQSTGNLTESTPVVVPPAAANTEQLFQRCLIDNIREGLVMIDRHLKVTLWNQAAEQLTGIRGPGMLGSQWLPSHVDLRDRYDKSIPDNACPIADSIRKGEQVTLAATVTGRGGKRLAIDLQCIPVIGHDMAVRGAVVLMHDQSSQVDLEQQVLTLYAHATRDQLTGVANRAHFERSLDARVKEFDAKGTICSLIVADIDFFKKINDDFGHHTGDHALMSFAKILQENTRVHDLVARYGGEEFVIVCPNCPLDVAVDRAEEIREALSETPIAALNGKCMTASFGVTEFQEGDTAVTAFVRADQALLVAKENGRNQVQYLQTESHPEGSPPPDVRGFQSDIEWQELKGRILKQEEGELKCPMEVLIEKIKGIVKENEYKIVFVEQDHVRIRINKVPGIKLGLMDRHTPFLVDIESRDDVPSLLGRGKCLRVRISVRVVKSRDRRHKDLEHRLLVIMRDFTERLAITKLTEEDINPKEESRY
jgi:diguanylate cyclase (GGDEF)-like protein